MDEPNEHEAAALLRACDLAGQYIDALGRTDTARWSTAEWQRFVASICGDYVDFLVEQQIALNTWAGEVQGSAG